MINRLDKLYRYSDYSVNFKIPKDRVLDDIKTSLSSQKRFTAKDGDVNITFYYSFNDWESSYFKINSIILKFIDFDDELYQLSQKNIDIFLNFLKESYTNCIVTFEIPSEDNKLLQSVNEAGFRLIETRLHYYKADLVNFSNQRYSTRKAEKKDIPNLKVQASFMRNQFDRFHSDAFFSIEDADRYLETYIENSINGFADFVIVPDDPSLPSDSFLTANLLRDKWETLDHRISKMVLSAVSSKTNPGWYIKLITEMTYLLKNEGTETIFMNTQSTNIAVVHTWEKLGYHLGRTTHLFSKKVD